MIRFAIDAALVMVLACCVTFCTGACNPVSPAVAPKRSAECDRLVRNEIAVYLTQLETACGTFARYEDCPDFARIEAEYRVKDAETAAKCEAAVSP